MHQFRSGREAKDYYTAALKGGDYYTAEEQRAVWDGELAKRLGLGELVTQESFARMCENRHPETGQPLTPRTDSDRTVGYDLNFHVPKSVSLLHVVSGDGRILQAIQDSVSETMRELEKQARTRVRVGGKQEEREAEGLAWGQFMHATARPVDGQPDPHLHVHCFVFNATYDKAEGRIKAGHFRDIKRDAPYHEAAFYSRLAWRLERMGYAIERYGKKWEVAGIPESANRKFSRRTEEVETMAKVLGIVGVAAKAALGARSRSRKLGRDTPDQLRHRWLGRMTADERIAIERVIRRAERTQGGNELEAAHESLAYAIAHRFERESVTAEPRLMEDALRHGLGKFRPETLRSYADRHPDLLRRKDGTLPLVTMRQVLKEEQAMLAFAREGRGVSVPLEGKEPWEPGHAAIGKQASRAIKHLLTSRDRVMLLRGGAGTGKTTLLRHAAKAIESRGHRITALATTADASRGELRNAGMRDADTIARFLDDDAMQAKAKGGVLWIDEAGMVGTPTMSKLFAIAEKLNARVVLCGDAKQHPSVERGDALRLIQDRVGLKPAEVTEVVRQRGTYKEAVEAIAGGKLDRGVEMLDKLGAIRETEGKDWVPLVLDYLDAVKRGRSSMVIAPTHAAGADITSLIRSALQRDGRLGQDERLVTRLKDLGWSAAQRSDAALYEKGQVVQFHRAVGKGSDAFRPGERWTVGETKVDGKVQVSRSDGAERVLPLKRAASFTVNEESLMRIAAGETVRASGGGRTVDGKHRINNGAVYRIDGFTPNGNLRLDNGWEVSREFGRFEHGYVSTSHAAQGRTVDWVFVAQGTASGRAASAEQFYVSVSRGREGVRVYTDDRADLMETITRTGTRHSAVELASASSPSERSREHASVLAKLRWYEQNRRATPTRTRERGHGYER